MKNLFSNLVGITKLENRIAELESVNKQLKQENIKLDDALNDKYIHQISETGKKLINLKTTYETKELEYEKVKEKYSVTKKKLNKKIEAGIHYDRSIEFYNKGVLEHQQEMQILQQETQQSNSIIRKLKNNKIAIKKVILEGKKDLVNQIYNSGKLNDLIQKQEKEINYNQEKIKAVKKFEESLEYYNNQKEIYDNKNEELSDKISEFNNLTKKYNTKHEDLEHIKKVTNELMCQKDQLKMDINNLKKAETNFTLSKKEYDLKSNKYKFKTENILQEKNLLEKDLIEQKKKLENIKAKIENKDKKLGIKNKEFDDKMHSIVELRELKTTLEPEIEKNKQKLNKQKQKLSEIIENEKTITEQLNLKQQHFEEISNKIKEKYKDSKILEKSIENFQKTNDLLYEKHSDECVFAILESDLKAGVISDWAPKLYKRLYRYNPNRAKKLLLEILARHPQPENFEFSDNPLLLIVDNTPIENIFASMISTENTSDNLQKFIRAWEGYIE